MEEADSLEKSEVKKRRNRLTSPRLSATIAKKMGHFDDECHVYRKKR